jgi:hypothetical protein
MPYSNCIFNPNNMTVMFLLREIKRHLIHVNKSTDMFIMFIQNLGLQKDGFSTEPSTNKLFGLHYNIYLALNA